MIIKATGTETPINTKSVAGTTVQVTRPATNTSGAVQGNKPTIAPTAATPVQHTDRVSGNLKVTSTITGEKLLERLGFEEDTTPDNNKAESQETIENIELDGTTADDAIVISTIKRLTNAELSAMHDDELSKGVLYLCVTDSLPAINSKSNVSMFIYTDSINSIVNGSTLAVQGMDISDKILNVLYIEDDELKSIVVVKGSTI